MQDDPQETLELEEGAGEAPAEEPAGEERPSSGAINDAIAEAQEKLERGEPIVPEEEGGGDAEEEPGEEAESEAEAAAGEEEEGPDAEAEAEGEGEEEEGSEPEEGSDEEDPDAEVVTIELPPRNADGDPVPVEVPAELEEDFRRLRNGYMRGEQAREERAAAEQIRDQVQADKAEVEFIDRELREDPVGFVADHVKDTEIRKGLLKELLADDELYNDEELQEEIRSWERDPRQRELFRTKQEAERLKERQKRQEEQRQTQEAREGVRETAQEVLSIIPEDFEPERGDRFYRRALKELGELAHREGRTRFSRDEIVDYLSKEGILDGFGIDAQAAREAASIREAAARGEAGDDTSSGGRKKATPRRARRATAEEARKTPERLKSGSKKRKAAAAYAPAGAGAPSATAELPKGQSVKDRIAHVRKKGLARILGQ